MLELVNVRKTFNPRTVNEKIALNGLNLKLADGDFVTVIGGNGAGKSTMLNAIAGVWPIDGGNIAESGTHQELMSKKGAYWRLYTTQFREEKEQELLGGKGNI